MNSLPQFLRVFITVLMAFPAVTLQFLALVVTGYGWVLVMGGKETPEGILLVIAAFATASVMHAIHLLAGHLVGNAHYHFMPGRIAARLGWDAAVHGLGTLVGGAIAGITSCMIRDVYGPGFLALLTLAGSGLALPRVIEMRNERFEQWARERPKAPYFAEPER